jgi:hypothetical protein
MGGGAQTETQEKEWDGFWAEEREEFHLLSCADLVEECHLHFERVVAC